MLKNEKKKLPFSTNPSFPHTILYIIYKRYNILYLLIYLKFFQIFVIFKLTTKNVIENIIASGQITRII